MPVQVIWSQTDKSVLKGILVYFIHRRPRKLGSGEYLMNTFDFSLTNPQKACKS